MFIGNIFLSKIIVIFAPSIIRLLYGLYKTFWNCFGVVTGWYWRDYNSKLWNRFENAYRSCSIFIGRIFLSKIIVITEPSIIRLLYELYKTFWSCIGVVTRWDRRDYNGKIECPSDHGYSMYYTKCIRIYWCIKMNCVSCIYIVRDIQNILEFWRCNETGLLRL